MSLEVRFAEAMGALIGPEFPADVGLAVSGGGDSMAMLTLAHNWTRAWGVRLWVVTVDHGLRAEAAEEAALVSQECAALGWPHATVRWQWDGQGNVMQAARQGRLEAIDRWRGVLRHVLVAHTQDDLAETFVMRLARGSGVEGLSAMSAARVVKGMAGRPLAPEEYEGVLPPQWERVKGGPGRHGSFRLLRPCLEMTRAELRHYLTTLKGRWVEDPTNEDLRFERARVRRARGALDALGLDVETLAATAGRMARARAALAARAVQVWREIGREGRVGMTPTGEMLFDREGFEQTERDTQMRLLAASMRWISGADHRPRAAPLEALLDRLLGGGGGTLQGCEAVMERDQIRVFREFKAVAALQTPLTPGDGAVRLWDGRWQVHGSRSPGETIRALGEDGWSQVTDPPGDAPPYRAARVLPSLWRGEILLACPGLGFGLGEGVTGQARLWPMGREMMRFDALLGAH